MSGIGRIFGNILAVAVCALLSSVSLFAQNGSVRLTLSDAASGEPVAFATVSLTPSGSTSAYKYALSDDKGAVSIDKVKPGAYNLKAELMGYKNFEKQISVSGPLDLGVVKMDVDQETLNAARVSDVGNPIIMKKDTIEYNASSFKTTDNDMLEDLLKKLPGVEVSDDGSVTVNGKTIEKVTIDGKTFFLDDPQLATKNLPAKMINKLKVVQKKSEQAEFTGIDDGEEETVLDLSVQPGMMNGLIGNLSAGAGHDVPQSGYYDEQGIEWGKEGWRYQANGFVGKFTEKSNIALILNANNTNNRGFEDFAGGMMGGMRGGGRFNTSGITTSWMAGLNGNRQFFDDRMDLGGHYGFSGTRKYIEEETLKTTYLTDGNTLDYNTSGVDHTNSMGHRLGIRLEHKFSENTSIFFEPRLNFGKGDFTSLSNDETYSNGDDLVSKSHALSSGDNNNISTSGRFLFRQRLGIPGRTLTVNAHYSFSNNDTKGYNQSLTESYDSGDVADSLINQRYEQNQKSRSIRAGFTYTEPIGNNFYVEGNYSFSWAKSTSFKDTYDSAPAVYGIDDDIVYLPSGEERNLTYSNNIENKYITNRIGANLLYQKEKLRAQVGVGVEPQTTHNTTTRRGIEKTYDNKVVNFAPRAMLFYDPSENTNVRLFYFGRSSQPSTSQLMPVPDNTDPLNVSFGNPYLEPYFSHDIRGEFRYTNKETFFSANVNAEASLVTNPVVNASWYGSNGAQYTIPVNGPASASINIRSFINAPIAKSDFSIANMARVGYSKGSSYVGDTSFDTDRYYQDSEFDYELFHEDYPDIDDADVFQRNTVTSFSATERLKGTYRTDAIEVSLAGRTRMQKAWYTVSSSSTSWKFSNQLQNTVTWTLPLDFVVKSDLRFNWYNGYTVKQDPEWIFNLELQKIFGSLTVAVKGYDIFNQAKSLSVSDTANYHSEVRSNTLGRYVILSLSWRFGNFGKMGGGPGPGGRRGGPPMGGPPPRF